MRVQHTISRTALHLLMLFASVAVGQNSSDDILSIELFSSKAAAVAGQDLQVALVVDIVQPWHVYAPAGNSDYIIPISPSFDQEMDAFQSGPWQFPPSKRASVAGVEEPASVYDGELVITNTLKISETAADSVRIAGEIYYQACDDSQCLIPATLHFETVIPVVADGSLVQAVNTKYFQGSQQQPTSLIDSDQNEDEISGLVAQYGILLTFAIIFLGGLALNLTPCVYPLIPITISFFGGTEAKKGHTFWMALAYVLGIAVTYSILGVVAALGGGLFGSLLTNPWVLMGIALLLVGLSLSMFGVYEFRLPTGLMTAASQSKAGVFGSLFMGLTLGIVAAPCVGPFVIGLLTYVAAQQSVVLGFSMFFTLAMGLGLPYLFLAMYSSRISALPRSGTWMVGVRVIFGFVLIAMAIYFIMPLLGEIGTPIMALFLLGAGVYLIMFDKNGEGAPGFKKIQQIVAIALIIAGTWLGLPQSTAEMGAISWEHPANRQELNQLLAGEKPVMIDVYADWCIPCKEMDKFTFPDPAVVSLSEKFVAIKIDMTHDSGEFEKYTLEKFRVQGVPTYIFMRDGEELVSLRSTGFEDAEAFSERMQRALSAN